MIFKAHNRMCSIALFPARTAFHTDGGKSDESARYLIKVQLFATERL